MIYFNTDRFYKLKEKNKISDLDGSFSRIGFSPFRGAENINFIDLLDSLLEGIICALGCYQLSNRNLVLLLSTGQKS